VFHVKVNKTGHLTSSALNFQGLVEFEVTQYVVALDFYYKSKITAINCAKEKRPKITTAETNMKYQQIS